MLHAAGCGKSIACVCASKAIDRVEPGPDMRFWQHTHSGKRSSDDADGSLPLRWGSEPSRSASIQVCTVVNAQEEWLCAHAAALQCFFTIRDSFIYVTACISTQSNLYARQHFSRGSFTDLFKNILFLAKYLKGNQSWDASLSNLSYHSLQQQRVGIWEQRARGCCVGSFHQLSQHCSIQSITVCFAYVIWSSIHSPIIKKESDFSCATEWVGAIEMEPVIERMATMA